MQKEPVVIRAPSFLYSYKLLPPTASIPIRTSPRPSLLSPQPLHRNEWNNSSGSGCPKIISLSVKRGYFTDKLLKINNLSVKRWVFTDKSLGVNQSFPVIPPWRCLCGSGDRRERGHCHGRSLRARKATPRDRNASISPEGERFPHIWPASRDYGHR